VLFECEKSGALVVVSQHGSSLSFHWHYSQGLQAFTDVDDNEKLVLDLWNRFIRSDVCISDKSLCERTMAFIQQHAHELKNARQQLAMHLNILFEHRLLSPGHLLD
jgi:hypothetical protein